MTCFINFVINFFATKKIVITTNGRKKKLTIHWTIQLLSFIGFIAIIYLVSVYCIRYNRYKNYNNYASIISENDALKKEHEEIRKELVKHVQYADKVNEYLINDSNFPSLDSGIVGHSILTRETSMVSMLSFLKEKRTFTYQKLNERKRRVGNFLKKVGISSIVYNKANNVANVSSETIKSDPYSLVSNITDEVNVGGDNENVKKIVVVKNISPISISKTKITNDNYVREIEKMTEIERSIKLLPFGIPAKSRYRITSSYGFRKDPVHKRSKGLKLHRGIDIVISDKRVIAPKDGVVKFAGTNGNYGKCVDIEHAYKGNSKNSFITRYAHLSKILVQPGQYVANGEVIGIQGSSGRATGQHMHYEVRINNQPVNPINFLKLKIV